MECTENACKSWRDGTTWEGAGARSEHDAAIFAREVGVRANGLGWLEAPARRAALEADGCTEDEVLEAMVDGAHTRQGAVEGQPLLALLARLRAAVYVGVC